MHTIAVIGLGNRGSGYLRWLKRYCGKRARVAALCEKSEEKLTAAAKRYGVAAERCYRDEDAFFAAGRLADAVFVCTGDRDHYRQAMAAIALGYHVLLEKPISPSLPECEAIRDAAADRGVQVVVCHVLRYMPYFQALYHIAAGGRYGRLLDVNHTENIGYFHFAHSFVRGNWRREDETAPMLLAKSCHDLDFINWLMGGGCQSVSSVGSLAYFTQEHAPKGAGARCLDCPAPVKNACPYDAERLYITTPLHRATFLRFMGDVLTGKPRFTRADKYAALRTGPYGRCVYACDNDVCDHQSALLDYGGRQAVLTVTAFAQRSFRRTILHLEKADVIAEGCSGRVTVRAFGGGVRRRRIGLVHITHRAGDKRIVRAFIDLLDGKPVDEACLTRIGQSVESHRLALLCEQSRHRDGERVSAT